MRLSGLTLLLLATASPALAESADTSVTVLRGASAPPPPVVVQTVVVPEIVYVPTYYPAYAFYPGYFVQGRRFVPQQFSTMGPAHGRK